MDELSSRVLQFIRDHRLLEEDEGVLVGLSGGPDSIALVLLLEQMASSGALPLRLRLAHLNHCLRGRESDRDQAFCLRFAARHGLSIETGRVDVLGLARRGESMEQSARRARHGFLAQVALGTGLRAIALGHQADDVAETVLMRLLRGCGMQGLGALRPVRPAGTLGSGLRIVRPLLEVRRAELLEFLSRRAQAFCADSSNLDTRILRNRIRHQVIPALERQSSGCLVESLCALNRAAVGLSGQLDEALDRVWPRLCVEARPGSVALDAAALAREAVPLRKLALKRALELLTAGSGSAPGLSRRHCDKLAALPLKRVGAAVSLPGSFTARREHGLVYLHSAPGKSPTSPTELPIPGRIEFREASLALAAEVVEQPGQGWGGPLSRAGPHKVFLSLPALELPLMVRFRRPGDRFQPLGACGSRKLKKFFIDRKLPRHQRDRTPLVVAADGRIAWIVGHAIAEPFRLTGAERRAVKLSATRGCC